jgi:hypothetical protein
MSLWRIGGEEEKANKEVTETKVRERGIGYQTAP